MNPSADGQQYTIRAIDRAVDVLMVFSHEEPVLPLAAVAERAHLSKATAFRVLSSLRRRGLIDQTPIGEYTLGFEVVGLAAIRKRQTKLWEAALPHMRRVRDAIDETVLLCIRVDDERHIIDQVESTQDIRRVAKIGERIPLYAGASSRILLAALPDSEVDAYLERTELQKLGPNTVTDAEQLRRELASVRELGYAIGSNERRRGGTGVAVGIRDYTGETVAAMQVTMPTERWTDKTRAGCLRVLAREAVALSTYLGNRQPHPALHLVDEPDPTPVDAGDHITPTTQS